MDKAKRARKAETPKQPSLRLTLRAPYLYPDRVYSARGATRVPTATRTVIDLTGRPRIGLFDQAEGAVIPPRHVDGFIEQAGGEHDWQMGAPVEFNPDFAIRDIDLGRHIDEVAEDLASLSIAVTAHATGHDAIEAAGQHQESHVEIHLKADG